LAGLGAVPGSVEGPTPAEMGKDLTELIPGFGFKEALGLGE